LKLLEKIFFFPPVVDCIFFYWYSLKSALVDYFELEKIGKTNLNKGGQGSIGQSHFHFVELMKNAEVMKTTHRENEESAIKF
jgi:hypothetical protein